MKKNLAYLIVFGIIFCGCKKKFSGPEWDTEILTPLANANLTVKDLIDTNGFVKSTDDNLLSIVYTNYVYTLENPLNSLISLSIDPFETFLTLESLGLSDQNINDTIRISGILDGVDTSPFIVQDGSVYPSFILPIINNALSGMAANSTNIDISDFIVEAFPEQAFFDLSINNSTSFDIIDLNYSVKNTLDDVILISGVVDTIKAFTTFEDLNNDLTATIGSNPVRGELTVEVGNFSLSILGPVPVNFDEYLSFGASIRDIKVRSAIAQFPAQEVVNYSDSVMVNAEGGVELTYARIDTGIVNVKAYSSIPTDLSFQYQIPNITQDNEQFNFNSTIDDTYNSKENQQDTNFFFNDFEFDFTINNDTITSESNSFMNTVQAQIDSTDGLLEISLEDTVGLTIGVTKIIPSYARGYLGTDTINASDTVSIDIWDDINGELDFETVSIALELDNQIGIDASIIINNLTAINSETNQSVTYGGSSGPFTVLRANEVGLNFISQKSIIQLDNANDLLSILPDKFVFDLDITLNPSGNTGAFDNFIHSGASIFAKINIDIPLVTSVKNLILSDTSDFDIEDNEAPVGFKQGTLNLFVDNGFPLDMDLALYFVNNLGETVYTLSSDDIIAAAIVDPQNQIVSEVIKTKLSFAFDNEDLDQLLNAEKMITSAKFNSSNNQRVKIYDYYSMNVRFVADFGYRVNSNR